MHVVDKSRAWLHNLELMNHLEFDFKVIVCVRELGQVWSSIERQHQKTQLVDFVDRLADMNTAARAESLFSKEKIIGSQLASLFNLQNLNKDLLNRIMVVRYEDLVLNPVHTLESVFDFLGVERHNKVNFNDLKPTLSSESDSHYHNKYLHKQHPRLTRSYVDEKSPVPPMIQQWIEDRHKWFYDAYYPKDVKNG
jgi:sulfotransferase